MTREELKAHCLKQIESCEMWARHNGEVPHSKTYEEHKLILELLEQEPCEDCIDRQRAIRLIKAKCNPYGKPTIDFEFGKEIIKLLKQMSPAKHETKSDVLDKIKAEIDTQDKWLAQAGYTAYNVDIAFNSIKRVLAESEV